MSNSESASIDHFVLDYVPEILVLIFQRAIPPYALLDTAFTIRETSSAWCQTLKLMKSIVLVCRSWYNVGISFLYENVCIRRCRQLEDLRQTLTSPTGNHLGSFVKSLVIQCYILDDRSLEFRADLQSVLDCCSSLSRLEYNAPFVPPQFAMQVSFPTNITHLRLEGNMDYNQLVRILSQLQETLLSFHLRIHDSDFQASREILRSHFFRLSSLQSLFVIISVHNYGVLEILRSQWKMPRLQRVTIAEYNISYDILEEAESRMQPTILLFLSFYGPQLRQLQIGIDNFRFGPESFKQLMAACPLLERITLHPSTFLRKYWTFSDDFFHPNLRSIDLTHLLLYEDVYDFSELCLSKTNLPALEHVRRFCNFPIKLESWLDECAPGPEAEAEDFVVHVFQHRLEYRNGLFLWRFEQEDGFLLVRSYRDSGSDHTSDSDDSYHTSEEESSSSESDWTEDEEESVSSESDWTEDDEDLSLTI